VKVLISGIGIAGPTLAFWLQRQGIEATLIERSPSLRTGGYIVDFWGAGFDIAERMGLLPDLRRRGYAVREVRMVDRFGSRVGGFSADVFRRAAGGRYLSIARGELGAALYATVERQVETIFGESIVAMEQRDRDVLVRLARSGDRAFDLVIGADGLHSNVRSLAFGAEQQFERYLGYKVAVFETTAYRPRDEDVYVMHTQVGQQVARFAMRDDRTMFMFVFADPDLGGPEASDLAAQRALLRDRFGDSGWECRQILAALETTDELYFDRVSQVRMPRWTRGRVGLIGDAAFCVSLLGGQGSALAMVAAYVLAGELGAARGDHEAAFARYQERLGELISRKQAAAERFAGFLAPRSSLALFLRNKLTGLLSIPLVARLAIDPALTDKLDLPAYS
jgi:2-polyprenyl-6-methoxyphenol hydroxylase-like FAD-dependent oxidoreductase